MRGCTSPHGDTAISKSLPWKESYAVGHEGLDEEHRRLVAAINDICAACEAGQPPAVIDPLFKNLERETERHLTHEDAVMHEIAANAERSAQGDIKAMTRRGIGEHIAEHERVLGKLRAIMDTARASTDCGATDICAELKEWFLEHAFKYDAHLKAIFQAF